MLHTAYRLQRLSSCVSTQAVGLRWPDLGIDVRVQCEVELDCITVVRARTRMQQTKARALPAQRAACSSGKAAFRVEAERGGYHHSNTVVESAVKTRHPRVHAAAS